MPRIEHIAMWVRNLDLVCAFYAEHFGVAVGNRYENPAKGFASRFLAFESGARIEVMTTTMLSAATIEPNVQPMGLTHLAISLGSEEAVTRLTSRLQSLGVPVLEGPRRTGDGYYESIILDPEGNRVELVG